MERLSDIGGAFPQACLFCSARVFVDGGYDCDPSLLDDKSLPLNVARYRPSTCPRDINKLNVQTEARTLLRRILKR